MKKVLLSLLGFLVVVCCNAQKTYLPATSEHIRHTPSGPANDMFSFIEQRGLVAYPGKDCDDGEGTGFVEDEKGKKYGSNRFIDVHLRIQHYKPAGKFTFDNIMKYNPPAQELGQKEASYKAEPTTGYLSRDIKVIDVANGKMLVVKDVIGCGQNKFDKYTEIFVLSYAVVGTTMDGCKLL